MVKKIIDLKNYRHDLRNFTHYKNGMIDGQIEIDVPEDNTGNLDHFYPVGCIFESIDKDFDPNVHFGGRWELQRNNAFTRSTIDRESVGNMSGERELWLNDENIPSELTLTNIDPVATTTTGEHKHHYVTSTVGNHSHTGTTSSNGNHYHATSTSGYSYVILKGDWGSTGNSRRQMTYSSNSGWYSASTQTVGNISSNVNTQTTGNHTHTFTTNTTGNHSHEGDTQVDGNHRHMTIIENTKFKVGNGQHIPLQINPYALNVFRWIRVE